MLRGSKPHDWEGLGCARKGGSAKRLVVRAVHRGLQSLSMGWGVIVEMKAAKLLCSRFEGRPGSGTK